MYPPVTFARAGIELSSTRRHEDVAHRVGDVGVPIEVRAVDVWDAEQGYTIIEDATLSDVSTETAQLAVAGPRAREVVESVAGVAAAGLAPWTAAELPDLEVTALCVEEPGGLSWHFVGRGAAVAGPARAAGYTRAPRHRY